MRTSITQEARPPAAPTDHDGRIAGPRWHRWLRLQAIPDIHDVYDFFRHVRVNGAPVTVLSWPSTRFHVFWPRALKKLLPAVNHAAMLLAVLCAPRERAVLVREFDNLWFLLLAPAFWPYRRRLVLNVNQNFSRALDAGLRGRALKLIGRLGFRLLWLDGGAALPEVRPHFPRLAVSSPYFPVARRRLSRPPLHGARTARDDTASTLGLVGYFREDKGGVAKAMALAQELAGIPGVRVVAGFWNEAQRRQFAAAVHGDIATCSTYDSGDYHAFLSRCHAVVVLAEREAYYYRHSGILMDCIAHGTLPVCPDYPLLRSIVTRPVPVGAVYGEHESLRCVVLRVLSQYQRLRGNFAAHAAVRHPAQVSEALEELLRPRRAARAGRVAAAE